MKSHANQIYLPNRLAIVASLGLLLCPLAFPCFAQQDIDSLDAIERYDSHQNEIEQNVDQQDLGQPPFDIFGEAIEGFYIYKHLEKRADLQKQHQAENAVEVLKQQLKDSKTDSDIDLDSLINQSLSSSNQLYQHMVKSTLYLGRIYDCGKCDRSHLSMSGGVVIDESGLALTNHHVLASSEKGTEGYMAMTYDGKCFEVERILAASKKNDIALVQLKANGHKFHAAPIARTRPTPATKVRIVSHPAGEFFALTTGEISRYSRLLGRQSQQRQSNPVWMEVTADFAGGSSGCGVFNSAGEVVGVASRIKPITRAGRKVKHGDGKMNTQPSYAEMVIRRCVNLNAIKACFKTTEPKPVPLTTKVNDSKTTQTDQTKAPRAKAPRAKVAL